MGSRGQSYKRQLSQLDRASEKYNSLQERADSIQGVGGRFYDRTGQEVPREEVEKLDEDLKKAQERFEDLRDRMIEREERRNAGRQQEQTETVDDDDILFSEFAEQDTAKTAAQRARERAEKRQATRERQAAKMPAGVRVTFPDGTQRYYAKGPDGAVTDQYGYPLSVAGGMKYTDLIRQIRNNQSNSGVKIERVSGDELKAMRQARREEQKPDYEMGIGTPWGNSDQRRAARVSRLAGRVARRRR